MPAWLPIDDHLVEMLQLFHQTRLQLGDDVMNPAAVHTLLQLLPDPAVYRVDVRTVGWPEIGVMKSGVSLVKAIVCGEYHVYGLRLLQYCLYCLGVYFFPDTVYKKYLFSIVTLASFGRFLERESAMLARSWESYFCLSVRLSVHPSVCLSHACFVTRLYVLFHLKFALKLTYPLWKAPTSTNIIICL